MLQVMLIYLVNLWVLFLLSLEILVVVLCDFNKLVETEVFLYDCSVNQIKLYYKNKSLNEDLHPMVGIESKKKKI